MTYEERTDFSNNAQHMNDTDVDFDYDLEGLGELFNHFFAPIMWSKRVH